MMGSFICKRRLGSWGDDRGWHDAAPAVEFRRIYRDAHGYMGVAVITISEPREPDDFAGPGTPPEFVYSCQVGGFDLDVNPTTVWHEECKNRVLRCWFETVSPHGDQGEGETTVDRFTYESDVPAGDSRQKTEVIATEDAMSRMEQLSKDGFRDRWNELVMRIRERKHRERVEVRRGMEERFAETVRRLDERIAQGTGVPEGWEPVPW